MEFCHEERHLDFISFLIIFVKKDGLLSVETNTNQTRKEMKIEDLVQGTSANEWVEALSRRATPQPQITRLRQQYDPRGHRIFDISERPDKAVRGTDGQIERFEKVARIALPLQRVFV